MLYYYKKTLTTLFSDLNELKNRPYNISLCFSIQEQLINRIRGIEKIIRGIKVQNSTILSKIRKDRLPKELTTKLKELVEYNNYKKTCYDSLLLIFRDIGDGIAFIYLPKWDIKPLVLAKEKAGYISHKKGLRLELKAFRYCKKNKILCIFNDITNSLRHGDLTFPQNGRPGLIELKSGRSSKTNDRAKRQQERAQNILNYLRDDVGKNVYPEQGEDIMYRRYMLNNERNHQKKIQSILHKALNENTNITKRIEKGLYYSILINEDDIESEVKKLPKSMSPIMIYVNELKHYKQGYYPFTLIINDPLSLYRFYLGEYIINVYVDANYLGSELARDGFSIDFLPEEGYFLLLNDIKKGIQVKISRHFFGRIGGEFLSLKWLMKEFVAKLETFESAYNSKLSKFKTKEDLLTK